MKTSAKISSRLGIVLALLSIGTTLPSHAATQSRQSLQQLAVDYVYSQADRFSVPPHVEAGQLDSRLRLPRCDQPLETYESPGGLSAGRAVVGVRCDGQQPWKIFVPVEITLPAQVIAFAHRMQRGDLISKTDLVLLEADLAKLRGQYFQDPDDVVGHRLKRSVAANLPLKPSMIDAQRLVKRGADVTIVADTGTIEVRMRGKALDQGGRGDRIQVKNKRSGRVITATVVERGIVRISP
jgi:flagella basal body P-ring formation protein FlgA